MGARTTSRKKTPKNNHRRTSDSGPNPSSQRREEFLKQLFDPEVLQFRRFFEVDESASPEEPLDEKTLPARPEFGNLSPEAGKVTRTFKGKIRELFRLQFRSLETGNVFDLDVTPEHPFWVSRPTLPNGEGSWIPVKLLFEGYRCLSGKHGSRADQQKTRDLR